MGVTAPRPLRRLFFSLLILSAFVILSVLLEPRKRSLSCRTIWSCLNPYQQHQDYEISTVPEEQQVSATEVTLSDGTVRFTRKLKVDAPDVLFLVLTRDGHSWSRDFQSTRRSVYDFLDLLASTDLEPQMLALGMLTESKAEYDLLRQATDEIPLGRVTILWRNATAASDKADAGLRNGKGQGNDLDRWKSSMALQRNYLMSRALLDEKHVVWVDAGIVEFSKGIVQKMIEHATARADVGIITARSVRAKADNYDDDAWALPDNAALLSSSTTGPDQANGEAMRSELEKSARKVPSLTQGTVDGDLIPLDSVGGTMLYVKADLIRKGLVFPWWKVVGTTWKNNGWVGLDTGGLCYMNSHMSGSGCFVLGGTHRVRHADWG